VTGLSRRELLRRGLAAVAAGNVYALVDGLTAPPARAASTAALPSEQYLLGGKRRYDRLEAAAAAGVTPEQATHLWRALGFPSVADDEAVFTRATSPRYATRTHSWKRRSSMPTSWPR